MPDHEEAVREARRDVVAARRESEFQAVLAEYERVIRASERAKYAALVDAATKAIEDCGFVQDAFGPSCYVHWVDPVSDSGCAFRAALAALQSKEGTNE